jgi:hypothetical protein
MNSIQLTKTIANSTPLYENFYAHAKHYYEEVSSWHKWMNRNVLVLASNLPRPAAFITYRLWRAAPYIATEIFLPSWLCIIGVIAVIAVKALFTPASKTPNLSSVWNGVGFAKLLSGTGSFLKGLTTPSLVSVISGLFWASIGISFLYYSGLAEKIFLNSDEANHVSTAS